MSLVDDIQAATETVTKKWAKQRKAEEKGTRARRARQYMYSARVNQTDVAWRVIPEAYNKASDNGRLPAHARQIFYAARGPIQNHTDRELKSVYFTQNLLPRFMNEHSDITCNWRVVFDPRGHLTEPHTDKKLALGTIEVDDYLDDVNDHHVGELELLRPRETSSELYPTRGPQNRYSAILFIEKEGFMPLFEETKLAERYDIAIMSTKGQSVIASRKLVDVICCDDVPVLTLHDFDKAGFLIAEGLTRASNAAYSDDRVRYEFENDVNTVDLGLRLSDVEEWDLESEYVNFKGDFASDSIATPQEQEFLRSNERVELNAFTSPDFIKFIEAKLEAHGIKKVVPDEDILKAAYRRAYARAWFRRNAEELEEAALEQADDLSIPDNLTKMVADKVNVDPEHSWDYVINNLAEESANTDEDVD